MGNPDETLSALGMNMDLCILRMFEDTFSLDRVHIIDNDVSISCYRDNSNASRTTCIFLLDKITTDRVEGIIYFSVDN